MITKSYTIKNGDNLTKLAKRFGTTVNDLAKLNNISDPDKIYIGDTLVTPDFEAMQKQEMVKQLLQQMNPGAGMSPNNGMPPELQQMMQQRQTGAGPGRMPIDPRRDAIEQSMPEALMMGAPSMIRGAGAVAAGGLGALAKAAPRMAPAGRIPAPMGASNVAAVGNNPAASSGLAQAMMNSKRGPGFPATNVFRNNRVPTNGSPDYQVGQMLRNPKLPIRKEPNFSIKGDEHPMDIALQEQMMRKMFGQ